MLLTGALSVNLRLLRHKNIYKYTYIYVANVTYIGKINTSYLGVCSYIISFDHQFVTMKRSGNVSQHEHPVRMEAKITTHLSDFHGHVLSIFVDCFSAFVISNTFLLDTLLFSGVSGNMGQTGGNIALMGFGNRDGKTCDFNGLHWD